MVLIPALPFLTSQVSILLTHAHRIILGFLLLASGFTVALVFLLIMETVFTILSLVLLAGQVTE